jgi:cytochrome P450
LVQAVLWFRRPIPFMNWAGRSYGECFSMRLPDLGKIVLFSHPDAIREIFTGDPDALRAGEANAVLEPGVGPASLLLLDGDAHMRQRRLMLPPLHGERMRAYAETMRDICQRNIDTWPEGTSFAVHPHMQQITLEIILRTVFGVDERGELEELRAELAALLEMSTGPLAPFFLIPALQFDLGRYSPIRQFFAQRARSDALIYRQIHARRAGGSAGRQDILSLLLEAVDEEGKPMSDQELRDELMTLLLAGHETTATALAWTFEQLLSHPHALGRLRREIDEVVGGAELDASHLGRLEYVDATVREVLRLRPVVPLVVRKVKRPVTIAGWNIPAGVRVAPCIYLAQRHPSIYDDPDRFEPERFLRKKPDPYAWLPFGGGIRRCIGMAFALYEMKVILVSVLSRLELELAEPAPIRVSRRSITLAPKSGTRLLVRRASQPRAAE